MYMLVWVDERFHQVVGNAESIVALCHVMEKCKQQYKVSNGNAYLEPHHLSVGGFEYWLHPGDQF